jgi:hypothetical protein
MPRLRAALSLAALFASLAAPFEAWAGGRQLHGGPSAGGAVLAGRDVAVGGTVGGHLGFGLTDAFRVYGAVDVPLGASIADGAFSLWPGASAGVAYSLDVGTWVPWLGLEARAHVVYARAALGFAVGGGARVGVDWLPQRYFGLSIQASYAALYFDGGLGHSVTLVAGPRWTVDL